MSLLDDEGPRGMGIPMKGDDSDLVGIGSVSTPLQDAATCRPPQNRNDINVLAGAWRMATFWIIVILTFALFTALFGMWGFVGVWLAFGVVALITFVVHGGRPWGVIDGGGLLFIGPVGLCMVLAQLSHIRGTLDRRSGRH